MREVDFAKQKTKGEKSNTWNIMFLSLSFANAQQLPRQREPREALPTKHNPRVIARRFAAVAISRNNLFQLSLRGIIDAVAISFTLACFTAPQAAIKDNK